MSPTDEQNLEMQPATISSPGTYKRPLVEFFRLFLAIALTGVLPVCWLVLFARGVGIPLKTSGWVTFAILMVIVSLIPVLCSGRLKNRVTGKLVGLLSFLVFTGVFTGIVLRHVGGSLPIWLLWSLFLSAAIWTFWLAWFIVLSKSRSLGLIILALSLVWGAAVPYLIKFDGLTGNARAKFTWAFIAKKKSSAEQPDTTGITRNIPLSIPKLDPMDFPEFLGNRQAVLIDRTFQTDWVNSPPRIMWKKPVGKGWGSFALIGDFGITLEQRDKLETVVCYHLSDGEELWRHADVARFNGALGGDGPRTTPTIDSDRVYTVGATGLLNCLDLATGERKWGLNVLEDNGGKAAYHGLCGSPLIIGTMVIVSPTGGAGYSLAAYDKLTGRRLWRAGKWPATYSSPMVARLKGVEQILIHNNQGIESHSLQDGELFWSYEWTNNEKTICSQPVPVPGTDNRLFVSIGYGKGSVLLEVDGKAEGTWSVKPLWTSKEMKTKFTTAVIHDGFVYGLDDGILACIDLQTGKRKWKGGRYKHGQLLLVGESLVIQTEDGDVVLVRANPKKLEEIGRLTALSDKTWNNPSMNKDYLVVRNDQEAICFKISSTESKASSNER